LSGIVWLASYPKSGNTWLRVFLANLVRDTDEPVDINDLDDTRLAASRGLIEPFVGPELSDLTPDEIAQVRPAAYAVLAREAKETLFIKIHDALTPSPDAPQLVPAAATRGVIYLIRNPLDVAISLAHHLDVSLDRAIARMATPGFGLVMSTDRGIPQLPQRLDTWSSHVTSWVDSGLPLHLMRYEEMIAGPIEAFSQAARFAGLAVDEARVRRAVELSRFEVLREQEEKHGFREKAPVTKSFFREGRVGSWRQDLSSEQAQTIVRQHGAVMRRFGYDPPAEPPGRVGVDAALEQDRR